MLDLGRVLAAPLCTMILGDLGAEVIKVERPGAGDETRQWGPPWAEGAAGRESAYFLSVNRNKRSVAADLATDAGRALVRRLAATADVLVENFHPGTLDRWGIGYEDLSRENPGLVFCSVTGYGEGSGSAGRPGYDFAIQAEAGWMSITGEPDGRPMKVGVALVDVLTGQNAAIAILAALRERERSGAGQRVRVSLFDSAVAGLVNVGQAARLGREAARHGNAHPNIVPYEAFRAADREVVVAVGNDAQWRKLCAVLELERLADDARFATNPGRVENRAELVPVLAGRIAGRPAAEWIERLNDAGVPCALVRTVGEAVEGAPSGEEWTMESAAFGVAPTTPSPIDLARTPPRLRRPPPALGEHTAEVAADGWGPPADERD